MGLSKTHCGKRRNCSLQAISPFPTLFSKTDCLLMHQNEYQWSKGLKGLFVRVVRSRDCVVKS